jgi:predicted nuclease with TOPRIM domain
VIGWSRAASVRIALACFWYVPAMTDNNIQSAMLEILKRIQADVSDVKTRLGQVESRLGQVESRQERMEDMIKKHRRDSAAMLVMMRGTVGVFDERMSDLEEDVRLIKERS